MADEQIHSYKENLSAHYLRNLRNTYDSELIKLNMAARLRRNLQQMAEHLARLVFK